VKTIGVLGGLGPQATMDFESRVHAVSQRLIPADGNRGYPPMAIYYHRRPPVLTDGDGAPLRPRQLDPRLLDAARRLGSWADFLVITSNGVHHLQSEIEAAAERPVLSMVGLVVAEVCRRGWRRAGVLTFIEPSIYQQPLEARGIHCEVIDPEQQILVDAAVPALAAGTSGPVESGHVLSAVESLRRRGVDGIILGCTELPLLLGPASEAPDLIDPIEILAEAAVRHAIA
jgi:aspartate racemase